MAKKFGLNPDWRQHVEVTNYHPTLSASVFSDLTNKGGGASMDVNTGEFVNADDPKKDTHLVGKEPDTQGKAIPTEPMKTETESYLRFPEMVRKIREATGGREGASIGSWKNADGSVDIDASAQEPSLAKALEKARVRNEKAIWSSKKFRETGDGDIKNPFYDPSKE